MSARENIFDRVRSALGRERAFAPPSPPAVRLTPPQFSLDQRIELFCTALAKLSAKTYLAESPASASDYVRQIAQGSAVWATDSPILAECGIVYPDVSPDKADIGVTGADYGLADTGSLVVLASSDPRLASLLPPVHIALLKRSRLLSGLDELLTVLPRPADQTSSMVLITGPSRTGDIEQILVRGVHGPGELHVILFP